MYLISMIIGISGKAQSGKDVVGSYITSKVNGKPLKFADRLKDMVCILLGCDRVQLENETFKATPLGEEWWYYKSRHGTLIPYTDSNRKNTEDLVKLTPRMLLQKLGTECGRQIIHPNIWINTLLRDVDTSKINVITDVRFLNEITALRSVDETIMIRIQRDSIKQTNHASETELDNVVDSFNYVIDNNGTIQELYKKIDSILKDNHLI